MKLMVYLKPCELQMYLQDTQGGPVQCERNALLVIHAQVCVTWTCKWRPVEWKKLSISQQFSSRCCLVSTWRTLRTLPRMFLDGGLPRKINPRLTSSASGGVSGPHHHLTQCSSPQARASRLGGPAGEGISLWCPFGIGKQKPWRRRPRLRFYAMPLSDL